MSSPTTNLSELLELLVEVKAKEVYTALPGKVESYNAQKQEAFVQPMVKTSYLTEEGDRAVENLPVIPNVPVLMPGAGGFRVTFPVQPGDFVLLVFSSRSIDKWLESLDRRYRYPWPKALRQSLEALPRLFGHSGRG